MTTKTPREVLSDFCAQHVPRPDAEGTAARILSALTAAGYVIERGWQPIETAPKDGTVVEVYAPSACGAAAIIAISSYHVDAGWTICTVREATHWRRHAPPVGEG